MTIRLRLSRAPGKDASTGRRVKPRLPRKDCSIPLQLGRKKPLPFRERSRHFKIASYKDLRSDQLQSAITFINACELRPQLPPPPPHPDGALVLTKDEAMRIVNFVYYWRYLFRPELEMILRLLRVVDSPKASKFCDVVVSLQLPLLEKMLKQHGFEIPALN